MHSVHQGAIATWKWQDKLGEKHARYYWVADQRSHAADRPRIARTWWDKAHAAYVRWLHRPVPTSPTASSFPDECVAIAEESGHNSVAGYFGTIYPPGSYGMPGEWMVSLYGYSWLNWPYSAQLVVAQQIYAEHGGSAWGVLTRAKCGI